MDTEEYHMQYHAIREKFQESGLYVNEVLPLRGSRDLEVHVSKPDRGQIESWQIAGPLYCLGYTVVRYDYESSVHEIIVRCKKVNRLSSPSVMRAMIRAGYESIVASSQLDRDFDLIVYHNGMDFNANDVIRLIEKEGFNVFEVDFMFPRLAKFGVRSEVHTHTYLLHDGTGKRTVQKETSNHPNSSAMSADPWWCEGRTFVYESRLQVYLAERTPNLVTLTTNKSTTSRVMEALREVIVKDELYNRENPNIVVFNQALEDIFNLKYCHVSEIRQLVEKEFIWQDRPLWKDLAGKDGPLYYPRWAQESSAYIQLMKREPKEFDTEASYTLTPQLHDVLKVYLCPLPSSTKAYPYVVITGAISAYIRNYKKNLIYEKNIKIALLETDPLGEALGVPILARCQVTGVLRCHLTLAINSA